MEAKKTWNNGERMGDGGDPILVEDAFECIPSETDQLRRQIEHLRRRVEGIANAYEGFKEEFLRVKSKPAVLSPPEYDWECDEIPKNARILTGKDFTDDQIEGYVNERLEKEEPLWRSEGYTREEARGIITSETIASIHVGDWFAVEEGT